ncbi:hypothetical protein AGMMS50243_23840 [Betaproteobacteria bacterium]|nr:hypothetical protein AGMMS50243_23840 [Betaproteobacteria bacterium]
MVWICIEISGVSSPLDGARLLLTPEISMQIQTTLDLHRNFRGEQQARAVERAGEFHPFLADLAQGAEAENLKTAGIGEDGFVPAHEAVQAVMGGDGLQPRPQPEVKSVAKADLRPGVGERRRGHGLDRAVSADRHERRGVDDAMIECDAPAAGGLTGG